MPLYKSPSRSSTIDSQDSSSTTRSSVNTNSSASTNSRATKTIPVQILDARFVDQEKLESRLDAIFKGRKYEHRLLRGQWQIIGAPQLEKQDIASLHL